jgi:hypothetical protein
MDTKSNSNWFHDLFIKEAKASFSRHSSGSSSGTPGTDSPDDGNRIKDKGVLFIDYDGTYLYSYTVKEAQKLTELPPLPEHEGLVCQGWNWTLDQIKEQNGEVVVGPYYITDDETTRFYISITQEEQRNVPLNVYGGKSYTIDWGDGTIETFEKYGKFRHEYANNGDYVIKVAASASYSFVSSNSSNDTPFGGADSVYSPILKKIERGTYGGFGMRGLNYFPNLETITNTSTGTFGTDCFNYSSSLKALVTKSVTREEFRWCYGLKIVSLSPSVTTVGNQIFDSCSSLVKVTIPNTVTSVGSSVFNGTSCKANIPTSAKTIGSSAYAGTLIEEINLPDTVTSLGSSAFKNCVKLKTVKISSGITSIQGSTFESCCLLEQVEIPAGVTSIASKAFYNCESLKKVVFKGSPSIAANAFAECGEMQLLDFTACTAVPVLSNVNAFAFVDGNTGATVDYQIRVPAALYDEWIVATNWSTYADKIVAV